MTTPPKAGIGRITAAIVAIAAMLPYLTIKILWMTGSSIGVSDPALMGSSTMLGMNGLTFGMDAVALVLALGFTMRWGMRLPGWLVLLPLWVGIGLLFNILASAPLALLVEGWAVFSTGGPIAPWIYMMVYGGFVGQGIGLMAAFALYVRDRWPHISLRIQPFHHVVGWGALVVACVLGGTRVYWALSGESFVTAVQDGVQGVLGIAGAVCLVAVFRSGRPYWKLLAVAWLGSGIMFGNSLFAEIVGAVGGPIGSGSASPAQRLVELFALLTGLVMGLAGAFALGVRDVQAVQQALEGEDGERDRQPAHHGHR
ncbi:hypothetical protein ACIBHX_37340 [Nonomuraea sp. NPDC050536]|uniref:hypothetical protein n=1 Tax=Nonomuraea sp. NPDC050536 TaxID=3364366 RepID=UPI0037C90437